MKRSSKKHQLKELKTQTKLPEKDLDRIKAGSGSHAIAWGNNARANAGGGMNNKKFHIGS